MQWDDSPNGGFTTGTPWLGVNPNYTTINAAAQQKDPHSIWSFYRNLIALRKEHPALARGGFEPVKTPVPSLLAYRRPHDRETLLAVHNFSDQPVEAPENLIPQGAQVLLSSYDREGAIRAPLCGPMNPPFSWCPRKRRNLRLAKSPVPDVRGRAFLRRLKPFTGPLPLLNFCKIWEAWEHFFAKNAEIGF